MRADEQKSSDLGASSVGLMDGSLGVWYVLVSKSATTLVAGPLSHPIFQRLDTATPTLKLVRVLMRFINWKSLPLDS
jgi:hypothetical protein